MGFYSIYKIFKDVVNTLFGRKVFKKILIIAIIVLLIVTLHNYGYCANNSYQTVTYTNRSITLATGVTVNTFQYDGVRQTGLGINGTNKVYEVTSTPFPGIAYYYDGTSKDGKIYIIMPEGVSLGCGFSSTIPAVGVGCQTIKYSSWYNGTINLKNTYELSDYGFNLHPTKNGTTYYYYTVEVSGPGWYYVFWNTNLEPSMTNNINTYGSCLAWACDVATVAEGSATSGDIITQTQDITHSIDESTQAITNTMTSTDSDYVVNVDTSVFDDFDTLNPTQIFTNLQTIVQSSFSGYNPNTLYSLSIPLWGGQTFSVDNSMMIRLFNSSAIGNIIDMFWAYICGLYAFRWINNLYIKIKSGNILDGLQIDDNITSSML